MNRDRNNTIINTITSPPTNNNINNNFNSAQWMENYNITRNSNIPVLSNNLQGEPTVDSIGLHNINNSIDERNILIDNILNNNNQSVILEHFESNLSENFRNTIDLDPNLNSFIVSLLSNTENYREILTLLRNNLNSGDINQLINNFLNSFLLFLRTSFNGDEQLALIAFESTMSTIFTSLSNDSFLNIYNEIRNNNITINPNSIVEQLYNIFNININENRIITEDVIQRAQNIININLEECKDELNNINENSIKEIENSKNNALQSLQKLITNKKFIIFILALLGTCLSGLPINSLLNNLLSFGFSNIDFNLIPTNSNTVNINTVENIKLRDVYDKILIKIIEKLK